MTDETKSAIGGTTGLGTDQQGNITYGLMNEQIVKEVQGAVDSGSGTDFIVIQRVRQGEPPRMWSTGDQTQTQQLFRDSYTALSFEPA